MDINISVEELLTSKKDLTITLTISDLIKFSEAIVEKILALRKEEISAERPYMTTEEVMKEFNICRTTLWVWNKNGTLPSYKFGKKLCYKYEDVMSLKNGK